MVRYTQQFRIIPQNESMDHSELAQLKDTVATTLGDGLQRANETRVDVDVPRDELEDAQGPIKHVLGLMVTVYLDEYYAPQGSPSEHVGDDAVPLHEALSDLDVSVSPVVNSAAPTGE